MFALWKYAGLVLVTAFGQLIPAPVPAADQPPKGDEAKKPRTDLYGDPLPEGAIARLGTLRLRHPGVIAVAFSPDGEKVASAGGRTIQIWETASGKQLLQFHHTSRSGWEQVVCMAFSRDGKRLASGGADNIVRVWDAETAELLFELSMPTVAHFRVDLAPMLRVTAVAFSTDGSLLACASANADRKGTIHVWDLATAEELVRLEAHNGSVDALAFSPDGKKLVSGGGLLPPGERRDYLIRIWDTVTGKELHKLEGHKSYVTSIVFFPDGDTFASACGRAIILWRTKDGKEARRFGMFGAQCLAASPNGKTLAAGAGREIRLWEVDTGNELDPILGHGKGVTCLAFTRDGKTLASGSDDDSIRLWNVETGKPRFTLAGHYFLVTSVDFSRDGKTVVTGGADYSVRLWNAETGKELRVRTFKGEIDYSSTHVTAVAFAGDDKTIAVGLHNGEIHLWTPGDRQEFERLGTVKRITCMTFAPDGKTLAVGDRGGFVTVWDVTKYQKLLELQPDKPQGTRRIDLIGSVAFSPAGKTLAVGFVRDRSNETTGICLWDMPTGKEYRELQGQKGGSIAFSKDEKLLAWARADRSILLWDVKAGQQVGVLAGHDSTGVTSLAFSPDEKTLASSTGDGIRIWDLPTQKTIRQFREPDGMGKLVYSRNGKRLACAGATVVIWDVETPPAGK